MPDNQTWSALVARVPDCAWFPIRATERVGPRERPSLERHRHKTRRTEWLAGRMLGKCLLSDRDGQERLRQDSVELLRGPSASAREWELVGSLQPLGGPPDPHWRGRRLGWSASLAHGAGWAVAGLSTGLAVGVDVEAIDAGLDRVVLRHGLAADRAWLAAAPDAWRPALAALLWTFKESVLKTGLVGPRATFEVLSIAALPRATPCAIVSRWQCGTAWPEVALDVPLLRHGAVTSFFQPCGANAIAAAVVLERRTEPRRHSALVATTLPTQRSTDMLDAMQISPETGLAPASLAEVTQIFADVTRYPAEILDADADLETDLGVDSVKLGEVFAMLRERFALPEPAAIAEQMTPDRMRTIAGISSAISDIVRNRTLAPAAPVSQPTAAPIAVVTPAVLQHPAPGSNPLEAVLQVFADVTRYPLEILDPEADLETDLGVDSVKLGEIFAVLREQYQLPPAETLREMWPADAMRTIAGIAGAISSLRPGEPAVSHAAPSPAAPPAPAVLRQVEQDRPFEGKVALVTGSGRGLGKTFVQRLAGLGAEVVVNSFHSRVQGEETVAEIRAAGGKAHHIWASVANPVQLHKMFDEVEDRCGGVDLFISNASNGMLAAIDKITEDHWEKAFRTNVVGLHLGAMRAAEMMKRCGGGRIVTLSTPGATRYLPYFACMGPVKAAVESLTRFLAIELAPHNIRVNCVSAGPVYGELVGKWPESEKLVPQWEAITAGGRLCSPDDVADMVCFLLGDQAKMMNGSIVSLDGGQSVRCGG